MTMGLIGSALGVAGTLFGGASASAAMRRLKRNIEAQRKANRDWYDRRYNEDVTQRADAQRVLAMTEESIRNRNRQAAGAQAVMGGTDESVAATKAANNAALADAASRIAANGDARKDRIEQEYMAREDGYVNQLNQLDLGKANAVAGAVQGLAGAAGAMDF